MIITLWRNRRKIETKAENPLYHYTFPYSVLTRIISICLNMRIFFFCLLIFWFCLFNHVRLQSAFFWFTIIDLINISVCVCLLVCMFVYVCVCMCLHVRVYVSARACIVYICMCVRFHACACLTRRGTSCAGRLAAGAGWLCPAWRIRTAGRSPPARGCWSGPRTPRWGSPPGARGAVS